MQCDIGSAIIGYEEAGHGRPVMWLHAFPLDRRMWRGQLKALAATGRMIAVDLRGFGQSSQFAGEPSIDQMADDVVLLLDRLGVREAAVVAGLSMGGYVALALARRHAGRLRGLILADTRAEADAPEARSGREQMIALAEKESAAAVIDHMMPRMVSERTRQERPQAIEEIRRIASAQSTQALANAQRAMRDRPDHKGMLGQIRVPALVIVGGQDAISPPSVADLLAAGIAAARRVTIANAGHLSSLEQPEDFNSAIKAFLAGLPRP
jgi:pimeloyl-ACP methyl ester carboxylesterase